MSDAPERIWIDAWGGNWSPVSGGTQGTEYIRADLHAAEIAALREQNKALAYALELAANRLHRCAIDYTTGSHEFIETCEWADEARAALDRAKG